ncbi:unnamed protein product [Schistocephalus solidus]|uniref:Caspase recruitment domain-containing protein 14 n=1 Tax=Schistocephalus solidus TaxID=70667 RepID=A0A183T9F3_SCHSO|nr:unnamed protein product [Schistocephalus solidus]
MVFAKSSGVLNTLGSYRRTFITVINNRGVDQRLPACLSASQAEGFTSTGFKALSTRVLEQLVAGVCDPQIRKILLRDRPPTLEKALALAREKEVLQAVCEQPSRSLFSVTAVKPHSSRDAYSQSLRQSCSCGSSLR